MESEESGTSRRSDQLLTLTTHIAAAYLENNSIPPEQVPDLLRSIHHSLLGLENGGEALQPPAQEPAVPIKRSIRPDYIVCLEDGKKLKMLRRYLKSRYNLSPEEYRAKWGLPPDYPMVAPNYASQRSNFAKRIGLGRSRKSPRTRA